VDGVLRALIGAGFEDGCYTLGRSHVCGDLLPDHLSTLKHKSQTGGEVEEALGRQRARGCCSALIGLFLAGPEYFSLDAAQGKAIRALSPRADGYVRHARCVGAGMVGGIIAVRPVQLRCIAVGLRRFDFSRPENGAPRPASFLSTPKCCPRVGLGAIADCP
jgi:hypothetical protein